MKRFQVMKYCVLVTVLTACVAVAGCATRPRANDLAPTVRVATGETTAVDATDRQRWLDMFARSYFPGRSGQVFVVPREGDLIVDTHPLYGFTHGSPWDYDVHVPLLFHGAPFIRQGTWRDPVTQQDVAPTLGALLGAAPAATLTGRVLEQALSPGASRPRLIVLMVLDGMRADYFEKYADVMPVLTRLRREGAWFAEARINYLPTLTSVGHATLGTGTDPRIHGLAVNNLFNHVTGKPQPAYDKLDPRELMALTLADIWNLTTDGKAVIVGQGGAIRATAGLVGHGACIVNGRSVVAASYNARNGGWETNLQCYTMPTALKTLNARRLWQETGGTWMGHDISNAASFRASSLFQRFEGDALAAVIAETSFGADDITDLLMVNMKGPDYIGHAYGPNAPETQETLAELDRQIARALSAIEQKVGAGQTVVAITADHGMAGEPLAGRRHYNDDIIALIHERFDPEGKAVVQYFGDTANAQIHLDTARLHSLGFSLQDVAALLEAEDYLVAAFTEDEVRSAQSRLPAIGNTRN